MTSVACVAAAIPSALALGPGAETTRPMSVVVIGGVTLVDGSDARRGSVRVQPACHASKAASTSWSLKKRSRASTKTSIKFNRTELR